MKQLALTLGLALSLSVSADDSINIQYIEQLSRGQSVMDFPAIRNRGDIDFVNSGNKLEKSAAQEAPLEFEIKARKYRDEYRDYVRRHYKKPAMMDKVFAAIPHHSSLASDTSKESVHVAALISGGSLRPYSYPVAKNHAAFAKVRNIAYDFVVFNKRKKNELGSWLSASLVNTQSYWGKLFLLRKWLEDHRVPENKWVVWIDDDIVINDFNEPQSRLDWAIDERMGLEKQDRTLHEQEALERLKETYGEIREEKGFHLDLDMEYSKFRVNPDEYPETKGDKVDKHRAYLVTLNNRFHRTYSKEKGNHTIDKNINTFKRFDYKSEGNVSGFDRDFKHEMAAHPNDAYVHHTGMPVLFRTLLIAHTLQEVVYPEASE